MTIGRVRSLLYAVARLLGDVNAVKRHRIGQRLVNRAVGRAIRRSTRKLWR